MLQIAKKLMDFGIDFQYENWGSTGEVINSHEIAMKITVNKGVIYVVSQGDTSTFPEDEVGFGYAVHMVECSCIEATT